MNIIKIGNVEFSKEEAERIYKENKYVASYKRVYQIFFSQAQNIYYGQEIYYHNQPIGITKRGRFEILSGKRLNEIIGYKLVNE